MAKPQVDAFWSIPSPELIQKLDTTPEGLAGDEAQRLIVLVIRSRRPFFKSRPSKYLLLTTLAVVAVTMALPLTKLGQIFGFVLLEPRFYLLLWAIVAAYIVAAEIAKRFFYRRVQW